VKVELLYFDGCPGYQALLPRLRELVGDAGGELELRSVETLDSAVAERFLGSPTVRVDGRDIDPTAATRDDFGLKCRLYPVDGRLSPSPPEAWIREALVLRS